MRRSAAIAVLVAVVAALPAAADATVYSPPNRPGPPLSIPKSDLRAAVDCGDGLASAGRRPVLLIPGTTLTRFAG